ncbi:MAG: dephospho-CoA kinase [Candidatus Margulisbacteria bacterium]|nr:dephospho-CoA kinase [Candidatus Margulisiibacteriota bacterium]
MPIIGLTGPAAAGKSEVARLLKRRGAFVIEADQVAHTLYNTQSPVWHELVRVFGSRILMRGGKINRKRLGEIVFADRGKLKQLNAIAHPALKASIVQQLETRDPRLETVVINAAVLKEIGLLDQVDKVWVVIAPKEMRLKRLVKSGFSKEEALRRINAQPSQAEYLKIADVVIKNEGTLKQLNAKVQACL